MSWMNITLTYGRILAGVLIFPWSQINHLKPFCSLPSRKQLNTNGGTAKGQERSELLLKLCAFVDDTGHSCLPSAPSTELVFLQNGDFWTFWNRKNAKKIYFPLFSSSGMKCGGMEEKNKTERGKQKNENAPEKKNTEKRSEIKKHLKTLWGITKKKTEREKMAPVSATLIETL